MITHAYRHFLIPWYESLLKRRRTFKFWRELEDSQWWSREKLLDLQLRRLRDLIGYCFARSPYYRELWKSHGLTLPKLQSLEDFCHWPITPRHVMREQADRIRATGSELKTVSKSTGGSSGEPLRLVIDHEANDRRVGAAFRGYAWAGAHPGTRQSHLWGVTLGDPSRLRRWKEHLYSRYLYRRDILNSFELNDHSIPQFLSRIHRFRPDVLVAYTNPLYYFARAIEERGLRAYCPRAIIVGAERLYDFQREVIQRIFSAPVFETYGSREFTLIAAECDRHAGLHLTTENLLVELTDEEGLPVRPGEEGEVVITDLFNRAMPFVRYAIGDRAVARSESCACGRGLPLLGKVVGRQLDMLVTADGRCLPGEFFPHLLKDYVAVRQFQVIQRQRDLVELKLVVDDRWDRHAKESLRREVQRSVGESTRLLINEVDDIELTRAGKRRVVVGLTPPERRAAS